MQYWPQQLNFAVWCVTKGCGISRQIFDKDNTTLSIPKQDIAFYQFHVYFTIRRILFKMGGIQSISSLPDDPSFKSENNKYDAASYKRICNEFGIDPSSDFRFKSGENHGLGSVYAANKGHVRVLGIYPDNAKFSDDEGTEAKISYIKPSIIPEKQADWFCPNEADGLTKAGLSRINRTIEAFVYFVLGAQVKVRSSILGDGGRAVDARNEFLVLVEDAIRRPDMAKSM